MKMTLFSLPCWGRWHGKAVTDEVSSSNENAKINLIHRKRSPFPNREGSRRGFTIVELAMALAIIVIVTAVSIGVVAVDSKTHGETIDMVEATNIAENAIECFRYAVKHPEEGQDGVIAAFKNALGKTGVTLDDAAVTGDLTGNYGFGYKANSEAIGEDVIINIYINTDTNTIHIIGNNSEGELFKPATYTVR